MPTGAPIKKNKIFLRIFFLLVIVLIGYYMLPWIREKMSASGGRNQMILAYPDAAHYDPNPSACHDTWGCVNLESHPYLPGELPVYPSRRLKHPTIIYSKVIEGDAPTFFISIDGSNEGSVKNPLAAHTMRRAGIPAIPQGAKVRVGFAGGALSDFHGDRTQWNAGMFNKRSPRDVYLYTRTSDGYYVDALLVRLVSASGHHTPWQKFCVMTTPSTPAFVQKSCGDYEFEIKNELGENAWLEFFNNSAWTWDSHLTGASTLRRDYFAKGAGLNGDRLMLQVQYIYGR